MPAAIFLIVMRNACWFLAGYNTVCTVWNASAGDYDWMTLLVALCVPMNIWSATIFDRKISRDRRP
jgi:hypothetical protein